MQLFGKTSLNVGVTVYGHVLWLLHDERVAWYIDTSIVLHSQKYMEIQWS